MLAPLPGGERILKVVDFGVARLGQRQQTSTGEPVGTRGYMPPEQAAGDCERMHPGSDVFALGLLLLEMLTLQVCAPDGTLFASIAVQAPRLLRQLMPQLRPEVPRAMWGVIERALRPQVARRFEDAGSLRLAVRQALRKPRRSSRHQPPPALPGLTRRTQGVQRQAS